MQFSKLLAAGALLVSSIPALAGETGRMPVDWFVLPEDQKTWTAQYGGSDREVVGGNTYTRNIGAVEKSIDHVIMTTADAFNGAYDMIGRKDPPQYAPANWMPWHLKTIKMKMAVSRKGSLGIVAGKTQTGLELHWNRTAAGYKELGLSEPYSAYKEKIAAEYDNSTVDYAMDEFTTEEEIDKRMEAMTQAILSTGRVKADKDFVKENLKNVASQMRDLMVNANAYNMSKYSADKYRVEVSVGADGWVFWGVTVGAEVRLRFEWKRSNYAGLLPEPQDGNYQQRDDFKKFVAIVAEDLEAGAREDLYADSGFALKEVRIGVGFGASGNIGLIKVDGKVIGSLFFVANPAHYDTVRDNDVRPLLPKVLPLITGAPKTGHIAYAAGRGIKYEYYKDDATGRYDQVQYEIPRDMFRKGMEEATKIGAYYAKRANATTHSQTYDGKWAINAVKPQFEASLSGSLGVVGAEGIGQIEFTFAK